MIPPQEAAQPAAQHERPRPFSSANLLQTVATGYIPLIIATLVVFLPLLWMLLSSFKQPGEIVTMDLKILPESLNLENYATAMTTVPFAQFFANSLIVTVVGSSIKVVLAILTAYALVFVRFPFKNVIFVLILVALMVPAQVSILPNYILIAGGMGGKNTLWGIILPGLGGTAFGTFLLRQHFLTLPPSILEAAEIDGAGHWRRLWQIIVPVSVPSIATVALVTVVSEWNDYIWPLIITDRPRHHDAPGGPDPAAELGRQWGGRLGGNPHGRRRTGYRSHSAGVRSAPALHRCRPDPSSVTG